MNQAKKIFYEEKRLCELNVEQFYTQGALTLQFTLEEAPRISETPLLKEQCDSSPAEQDLRDEDLHWLESLSLRCNPDHDEGDELKIDPALIEDHNGFTANPVQGCLPFN